MPASDDNREQQLQRAFDRAPFTMLTLIEAGHIKATDDTLATMQNLTREQAHTVAKWLAITTNSTVFLRLMTIGASEDISYTPEQVWGTVQRIELGPKHCGHCGRDRKDCICTPEDLD